MKIAVTGASGHVGTNLCRMLLDQGYLVRVLIHDSKKGLEDLDIEFVTGSVNCEDDLRKLCEGCSALFHLAAFISIRKQDKRCMAVNTGSCETLLSAARSAGVRRIIHFSSIHAFSQKPYEEILDEKRDLETESSVSYNRSKALGQKIMTEASSADPEVVVLNPTAILGPNDFQPSLLGNALVRFYKGQNSSLIPGGYDWVDVRDVCSAAINAIDRGKPGECYLLAGSWRSLKEMAAAIEKLGGHKVPALTLPFWLAQIGAVILNLHATLTGKVPLYTSMSLETLRDSHRNISSARARENLGFNARPFEETMADTLRWFKDNNYI
ncbi:MAG: NAD-dependent epimerase/dehydratase family protein [Bacteroidales bacterium]|nr:NAD-dependent epimerase/dehydratase family protein [Bacteroidales bacterium]MDT8372701.1 NAD-dependent epimerase/dehydratase family protein [Bacteroidales bacterium]